MDFSNTSGIRSPFSPRVRQSITGRRPGLSSAKKNQSKYMQSGEAPAGDVIYKTPLITVETFGHPLPVLVTEALTFASGEVSVRLSPNGYCWLVCGRRLLCWARDGGGAARELTLPQTDLQHRAELVEVFYEDGAQMPSCIGVSPEGVVRYWPSVGQELYADTSCELAGQECARLCAAAAGLLLATTSCSLLMLHPDPSRVCVSCQALRPPSGWLGGLGRRVSLLFFGSTPASADTKLVGVVVLESDAAGENYIALVGGGGGAVLQLWRGTELHEHNLRNKLTVAHRAQGNYIALVGGGGGAVLQLWRGTELHEHNLRNKLTVAHRAQGNYIALVGGGGGAVLQLWRGTELHEHNLRNKLTVAHRAQGNYIALVGGGGGAVLQLWRGTELHEHNLRNKLTVAHRAQGNYIALVGGGGGAVLQLWRGTELHEHNLRNKLTVAHRAQGDVSSLQVVCVDVRAGGGRALLLLVAVANVARSPEMRYAIAHMSVEDPANPVVTSLVPLRGCVLAGDCAPRLLPLPGAALLYTSSYVARVSSTVANDKVEYIDVSCEGDRILGAELCARPLLFSRKHGVLALSAAEPASNNASMCESPMGSPCPSDMYDGNLSLFEIDPHEVSMVTTDACGKLKTAFLFHVRRDAAACRAIVEELFPAKQRDREQDSALDRTVVRIATELCDDVPQGDPRWKPRAGPATSVPLGSSSALQITQQLRDKQRAFSLFADFLRATGLWQRLGVVSLEEGSECISTVAALGSLAEKLAVALTLRKKQQSGDSQLIDDAIYQVVCGDDSTPEEPEVEAALSSGALSPTDVCFRRVSRVQRVLCALAAAAPAAGDARAHAAHATNAARLLASVLHEVHRVRAQWGARAPPSWGPAALLPALLALHHRAVAVHGVGCPDETLRAGLLAAAAVLADLVLTEAEPPRGGAHARHLADKARRDVIQPYIEAGQTERAAVLAEKFKDFELLVDMCVQQQDMDRLYSYIDKYSGEGIAEIAFAHLMDGGGARTAQLIRALGSRYPARLQAWLARAPARAPLLALQLLCAAKPARAAAALAALAHQDTQRLQRLTTTASLAKLCLLASDECHPSELWNKVESCLSLAEQHAALPRDIKLLHGLDSDDCRVLPAEDLVQMYIDCESESLTEYDYKKALDLTDFVEDMERRDELRLRVWCACIRRSSWEDCNIEAPAAELQDKMFFRLMHLVHVMGGDLELLLPPAEDILTARELAELVSDSRFRYLVKFGYECFHANSDE